MSQDTVRVASTAPMSIRITEPRPDNARPGNAQELKSAVINGGGHGGSVTEGVDAKLYRDWIEANPGHPAVVSGLFREIKDDDGAGEIEYGFEPALERAVKDAEDNSKEGSVEGDKPARHVDMDAHSDVPNDDSPRSQTETGPAFVAPAAAPEPGLASGQTAPVAAPSATERPAAAPPHTTERQPFNLKVTPEHREPSKPAEPAEPAKA